MLLVTPVGSFLVFHALINTEETSLQALEERQIVEIVEGQNGLTSTWNLFFFVT